CFECDLTFDFSLSIKISKSYKIAHQLLTEQLQETFTKLLENNYYTQIQNLITQIFEDPWCISFIDQFLEKLFFHHLAINETMLTTFSIDQHQELIRIFLKNPEKCFERVKKLLELDIAYIYVDYVQQRLLFSKNVEYIDHLIQDEKCLTLTKLKQLNGNVETKLMRFEDKKLPGFTTVENLLFYANYLTNNQQLKITNILHNDYLEDKTVSMSNKFKAIKVLKHLKTTYPLTLKWSEKIATKIPSVSSNVSRRGRGANSQSFADIALCLPAMLDLFKSDILKIFDSLMIKINASNAKYVSDAMLVISRKLIDEQFLGLYLKFVKSEQFPKLG
ncbi:unnamed protein product, partial [Didymodactylos carnosus]